MSMCVLVLSCALLDGCNRTKYRRAADRESYCLIESRETDPRWEVPIRTVEPQPASRMYFAAEQDCGLKPQDDPAAHQYMDYPDGFNNTKYYSKIGDKGYTENPMWAEFLPRNNEGEIELNQPLAMDLALLNSREYQTQYESVYLTALDLSSNRFEFDAQWFGGVGADFTATGEDLGDSRFLDVTASRLGFTKNLPGGGQFATGVLNNLFWDFGSSGIEGGSAALVTTFTQPLLRGAFRYVRLESLTQAERNLLYSVRDFARFRRLFYVDVATGYLNLLNRLQGIRNARSNVENLRQNLVEYNFYVQLEIKSQIERDQVFQQYQNGRSSLLGSEQGFAQALDAYRFQLGLPSWVPLELDESLLTQFELVNPEIITLQEESQELFISLMEYLPPTEAPRSVLQSTFDEYREIRDRVEAFVPEVDEELNKWIGQLKKVEMASLSADDRMDMEQQVSYAEDVEELLTEMKDALADRATFDKDLQELIHAASAEGLQATVDPLQVDDEERPMTPNGQAWEALQQAIGEQLRGELADLYLAQTLVRLFLIEIEPHDVQQESAITYALNNRLDVMNSKATVMDAFRRVEVAADALESDLTVSGGVTIGSDPSINNAYRFDSSANRYRVGVEFDGPLNRLNERNVYRATQIAYQRASRSYIADKDLVANEVREILRQLELSRLNFQIARQTLVAATRQVDQTQIDLRRSSAADSNLTLLLLGALDGQLSARNNLISNWVQYRIQKMNLFAALDMLYLDETGHWINEESGWEELANFHAIDPDYFPPQFSDEMAGIQDRASEEEDGQSVSDGEPELLPPPEMPPIPELIAP
ncbi:TolC family protein [Bythopirellula goksoeyrii]|nr:TolC family protein [Bythopirellula goksoeyrii]